MPFHRVSAPAAMAASTFVCLTAIAMAAGSPKPVTRLTTFGRPSPPAAQQASAGQQAGQFAGDETCTTCHQDQKLAGTSHGRAASPRTPAATSGRSCESCHGPGLAHAEAGGDARLIRRFSALPPRDASAACLACHERGNHVQWTGSAHDSRNMSCVSCHSVHSPKETAAQLKAASELDTCGACHKAQVLKIRRPQHMPVVEGKMTCSSCHNPHGSTNVRQLRVGNWINESCVSCHTEKRGPFLWEHAAGRESCVTCHDPHGSSNDRMLVAKVPMLCQRCHIGTRHPSTIYDGRNVAAAGTPSNRIYGRGCVTCHQNIHGSNHPSGHTFVR